MSTRLVKPDGGIRKAKNRVGYIKYLKIKIMSILSTLLTGGTVVGKICQSLASALSATDDATGIKVSLSAMNIGGVKFMRSNAEDRNTMRTYAFNSNTEGEQSIAFPNIGDAGSASFLLGPTQKIAIDNFLTDNVPPDTSVVLGPATNTVTNGTAANDGGNVMRFIVKNLTLSKAPSVGLLSISCSTTHLLIIVGAGVGIVAIKKIVSLFAKNRNGNEYECLNNLEPVQVASNKGEGKQYLFEIPFNEFGFVENDVLDELILSLEVTYDNSKQNTLLKDNFSMHPVEMKLLQELSTKIKNS